MVDLVDPVWTVRDATPAERGFCRVYRVVIEAPGRTRECYLKAAPEGADAGVAADARVLAVLHGHTGVPVPEVLGVVDDRPEVPSPFYLMTPMPGEDLPYEEVGWLPDEALRTLAREVGTHLGELHRIDAVDSFGHVGHDRTRTLDGGRPSGSVADLTVRDGVDSWPAYLRGYVERELERHADSRFDHLTPRLESWFEDRIDGLDGSSGPVLGRNDHGLHNLLVEPGTGEVTAMLDWAYTLAVAPAFDLGFAAYIFGGAFLRGLPDVRDRRELVRESLLSGYRSTAPRLADAVPTRWPLYELLASVRVMNDFERLAPNLPEGTADDVAEGIRMDIASMLDGE
jgi:aminoglycoside phosphotransferase (APT) family kinase protein